MGNTRKKRIEVDMCSGRMLPQMLRFAGPLILSSVLQLLFNAADVIVVGQFGSEHSLAAVGSTGTLVALVTNLLVGLAMGATVMASQHVGAKNDERVHATVHSSIAFSLLIGAVLSVVCLALNEQSLTWMLTPAEVKPLSAQYLYIYYSGLIFVALYNFGAALLRAKGDTRRPLTYLIIAGVLNVFLNLFFVIVFKMDVAGVALATIISQALSAVLVLRCLMREEGAFRLEWRKLRLHKGDTARLLRIGVPAGLQQVIFNISNLVIQSAINSFGPVVMAGSAGSVNIENLIGASTSSLAQTGMTFISANLGAGKFDRVDKAYRLSLFSSILAGVVLGGLAALLRYPLMHIYSTVPAEINAGAARMIITCSTMVTCAVMDTVSANIRGLGYSTTPAIITLIGACGFRLVWIATLFQMPGFHTPDWLFISYPISWTITSAVQLVCYAVLRRRFPKGSEKAPLGAPAEAPEA